MAAPESASRYVLGREIARGGLGRVVEAFDTELKRTVAVKLVLEDLPLDVRERFVREAELTARLEHPNIVPVHGLVGLSGAPLQLAMKRIVGRDLGSLIDALADGDEEAAKAWSRPRLLAMFQHICLGVAFAHDHGVIHRDLKPSNVMIGDYGETLVVDWGLAKESGSVVIRAEVVTDPASAPRSAEKTHVPGRSAGSSALTLDGDVVGTPAYMPPEQAMGRVADVDERSDIYALGAILFEILTLRPPVVGDTVDEVLDGVRAGAIEPPSKVAGAHRPGGPIPPELDAIVLKALALRRNDRYQTARALHDDIQLFLEGVKEREQRQKAARERVEAGKRWLARYRALKDVIDAQERLVHELTATIHPHQPPAEKRPLWDAEALLRFQRDERIDAFSKASTEFGQALTVDPGNVDAHDGKCELFLDRFLEAERRRDRDEMLFHRNTLALYDAEERYAAKLEAPGTLSIRAWAFDCGCLAPVKDPRWRVEIRGEPRMAWVKGQPVTRPVTDRDRPVPAVRVSPAGLDWGHGESCPRRELKGVEVWIAKYEERDRRLALGEARRLGLTPLQDAELAQGSYLCTLRPSEPALEPLRLPVLIRRASAWSQDVHVYAKSDHPPGFRLVAGGPYRFPGPAGEDLGFTTRDLFVAEFPVTCGEYLDFLNALGDAGKIEEARLRQPREADKKWWIEDNGRFRLPTAAEDPRMAWDPRWPVLAVDWYDAVAYAAWKSTRDGIPYRLMHEEEHDKAARGVDGRSMSYGDTYDGSYSHSAVSLPGRMSPLPVGSFPADESPYGVRDLCGGMSTWCWNALEVPHRDWRATRGCAWSQPPSRAGGNHRRIDAPTHLAWFYGIRLAAPAEREAREP